MSFWLLNKNFIHVFTIIFQNKTKQNKQKNTHFTRWVLPFEQKIHIYNHLSEQKLNTHFTWWDFVFWTKKFISYLQSSFKTKINTHFTWWNFDSWTKISYLQSSFETKLTLISFNELYCLIKNSIFTIIFQHVQSFWNSAFGEEHNQ